MTTMQNPSVLKKQYNTDEQLQIRINLHNKYSVNKEGFRNWTYRQLPNFDNNKVLELGCGNGELWVGKNSDINKMDTLYLTDISEGMISKSKESVGDLPNIRYMVLDAENTNFESESVDYVIANHMLYHVPDLDKTLLEIKRILKTNGKLYATTFGENGIIKYVNSLKGSTTNPIKSSFTLQNGSDALDPVFNSVQRVDYIDSLRITNEYDLLDYIYSMSVFLDDDNYLRDEILSKLKNIKEENNGVIEIKKEAGIFIAEK